MECYFSSEKSMKKFKIWLQFITSDSVVSASEYKSSTFWKKNIFLKALKNILSKWQRAGINLSI